MERISDRRKCMASLAVFRKLYDSKKDIYEVISEFAKQVIVEHALYSFELQEIKRYLKEDYGFDLPSAVIRPALKRLKILSLESNNYIVDYTKLQKGLSENFLDLSKSVNEKNQQIIDSLILYVTKKKGELSTEEKEDLIRSFCVYVIDDTTNTKFSELISTFLLSNKDNVEFVKQLNQIKQGIIIYVGLTFNVNSNNIDSVDQPLNIYLETEIMFSMAGYNGLLFKQLFDEFYQQVTEINNRLHKNIIKLFYFSDTKNEIDSYFNVAEHIVRGDMTLDPSKQAMINIVNNCVKPYQVVEKKVQFYQLLKEKGITLDNQEKYFDKENQQYNIDYNNLLNSNHLDASDDDINRTLNLLNYVNIKRGSKSQMYFRNIGHILLSGNKLTFKIASDPNIKKEKCVPLVTSLSFLTDRFWLSLNKGMSKSMNLLSFDIITKAQIALSASMSESIGRLYKELLEEDETGHFNPDQSKRDLANLHSYVIPPENLTSKDEDSYLNIISMDDINKFRAEQELQNESLIKSTEEARQKVKEISKERDDANHLVDRFIEQMCSEKNKQIQIKYQKEQLEYKLKLSKYVSTTLRKKIFKTSFVCLCYCLLIVIAFLLTNFLDNKSEGSLLLPSIVSLLLFSVPFVRPIVDHTPIKKSFMFIFSKKARKEFTLQIQKNFKNSNMEPKLNLLTPDDIKNQVEKDE